MVAAAPVALPSQPGRGQARERERERENRRRDWRTEPERAWVQPFLLLCHSAVPAAHKVTVLNQISISIACSQPINQCHSTAATTTKVTDFCALLQTHCARYMQGNQRTLTAARHTHKAVVTHSAFYTLCWKGDQSALAVPVVALPIIIVSTRPGPLTPAPPLTLSAWANGILPRRRI